MSLERKRCCLSGLDSRTDWLQPRISSSAGIYDPSSASSPSGVRPPWSWAGLFQPSCPPTQPSIHHL